MAKRGTPSDIPPPLQIDSGETGIDFEGESSYNENRIASSASKPMKMSGIFGTSSNLVNSIVGAGIIGIPFALRQCGLVAGVFLLVLVGILTDKSLRIIVGLANFHPKLKSKNVNTYEDLMEYPFGRIGSLFILFNMFILAYGAMVAYLLIIKHAIPTALGITPFYERELIMVVTSFFIMLPLSLQRDMASLSFTSLLSIIADVILVVFVAIYSPVRERVVGAGGFGEVLKENWLNPTIFIGLGILSTAMACQHSAFIVSGSLKNATMSRWYCVSCLSISIATVLCSVLGICGYLGFLDETDGDILENFQIKSTAATAARFLLAITMVLTYPMESLVARHVIIKYFFKGDIDGPMDEDGKVKAEFCFLSRRVAVSLAIYLATLFPALLVNDIGPVLSITGSLGGSMLSYMAPGMLYLGVNGDHFMECVDNYLYSYLGKSKKKSFPEADTELPIDGDATQQMQSTISENDLYQSGKPWWWFPTFMPIWIALASGGRHTMNKKLSEGTNIELSSAGHENHNDENGDTFHPTKGSYITAIFFIIFGTVGVVAGVGSNIYVQVKNVFFSPH